MKTEFLEPVVRVPFVEGEYEDILARMVDTLNELYARRDVQLQDDLYALITKLDTQVGRLQGALR